jgi:hypothetical protein
LDLGGRKRQEAAEKFVVRRFIISALDEVLLK